MHGQVMSDRQHCNLCKLFTEADNANWLQNNFTNNANTSKLLKIIIIIGNLCIYTLQKEYSKISWINWVPSKIFSPCNWWMNKIGKCSYVQYKSNILQYFFASVQFWREFPGVPADIMLCSRSTSSPRHSWNKQSTCRYPVQFQQHKLSSEQLEFAEYLLILFSVSETKAVPGTAEIRRIPAIARTVPATQAVPGTAEISRVPADSQYTVPATQAVPDTNQPAVFHWH